MSEETSNSGVHEVANTKQVNIRVRTNDGETEKLYVPKELKLSQNGLYWSNSTVSTDKE